jgi:hypothetical protein
LVDKVVSLVAARHARRVPQVHIPDFEPLD